MHIEPVEIYSDATNAAVMKHPGRQFPGLLVQGDSLYILCNMADRVCAAMEPTANAFTEANELRNHLWSMLNHYKMTLIEHEMRLPFNQI